MDQRSSIPVVVMRLVEDPPHYVAYPVPRVMIGHGDTVEETLADLRTKVLFFGETGFTPPAAGQIVPMELGWDSAERRRP